MPGEKAIWPVRWASVTDIDGSLALAVYSCLEYFMRIFSRRKPPYLHSEFIEYTNHLKDTHRLRDMVAQKLVLARGTDQESALQSEYDHYTEIIANAQRALNHMYRKNSRP